MSFDNQNKKIYSQPSNDSSSKNKKEFDSIKEYLNAQPEKINQLNDILKTLNNVINNFIEYTKNYSGQIEFLAMKIIPNYTIEGQLMQTIQTILLFYSESLNSLMSQLRDNLIIKQDESANEIIEQFKVQKKIYSQKIKNVNSSYKNFKNEINLYQEYLVNKEFIEHNKKGSSDNIGDNIVDIKENIINEENKGDNENKKTNEEDNPFEFTLSDVDNKSQLIKSNKEYIKYIKESNDILNRIRQFLSIEKTNFLKSIYNLCYYFGEGLLNFSKKCINNFETQAQVLKTLLNKLILDEKDTTVLTDYSIKLKYLEIYNAYIQEKNDSKNNEAENPEKDINKNDNKNNDINIGTIDDKKNKKNKKNDKKYNKVSNVDNLDYLNKNELIGRRTISLSNKQLSLDYLGRNTFSPNQTNIMSEEEKEQAFKSMVTKLNIDEIINIFEKIRDTKIELNKSDIELIDDEKNYKKIREIIFILFIHPENYQEKNKDLLIDLFEKDKKYILYFIKVLNDHRAKGNFFISEFTLKYFGEIFKYLNNFILSQNNMEIFKYILILSQTYYYSGTDKKKIYLFSYIKDYPAYSSPKFWEDYLKELIKHDLKNLEIKDLDLDNINLENFKKDEKEKLINCFFSNLLTVSKAMADFNLDNAFVKEFLENKRTKYFLSKEQIDNICLLYEMSIKEEEGKNSYENKSENIEIKKDLLNNENENIDGNKLKSEDKDKINIKDDLDKVKENQKNNINIQDISNIEEEQLKNDEINKEENNINNIENKKVKENILKSEETINNAEDKLEETKQTEDIKSNEESIKNFEENNEKI